MPEATSASRAADRRGQAISRLLDATIDSLAEVGYTGTTVRRVAERAGVSQGGATHHFPQRLGLIVAALDELGRRADNELRGQLSSLPDDPDKRQLATIDLMRSFFEGLHFAAWARLWIAASEDDELREAMRPVERRTWEVLRGIVLDALPELASDAAANDRLAVVFSMLRGFGLQQHFDPRRDERSKDLWPSHRAAVALLLDCDPTVYPAQGRGRRR